jgi:hypothetical protein
MSSVGMRLLGDRRSERHAPIASMLREVSGVEPASADAERAFLHALLRARGHAVVAEPLREREHLVAGVVDREGRLEGLDVLIVAVGLAGDPRPLAKTQTNVQGEFSVKFQADDPVIIRVILNDDRRRLYVSPPRRAEPENWLEWSASGRPAARPGAFELREAMLDETLRAHRLRLEDLEESFERLQISLLAETTGLSRGHVAVHALAARLEKRLAIPRAPIFALLGRSLSSDDWKPAAGPTAVVPADGGRPPEFFRQLEVAAREGKLPGLVIDAAERAVLSVDGTGLRAAVAEAVRAGVISAREERRLDDVIPAHARARARRALDNPVGQGSSWREVLSAVGLSGPQIEDAATVLLSHPPGESLRRGLAELAPADQRPAVLERFRLAELCGNDAKAVRSFLAGRVTTARELATRPTNEIMALAGRAFEGPDADRRTKELLDRLDRDYAGESLARRLQPRLQPATRAYLERAGHPDILTLNIEGAYRSGGLGADRSTAAVVRADLLPLQRMGRLTRHAGIAARLVAKRIDSAAKIAFTDPVEFVATAGGTAEAAELRRLHRRARAHYRATVGLFVKHNQQANGPALQVLAPGSGSQVMFASAAAVQDVPTWELLFGSPDYCDCGHCDSVTSPAAYLVDLLLWLGRAPGGAPRPYQVLTDRRPDLVKILLNCANTQTLVPYIDLACELLEEAVAIRADARANPTAPTLTPAILAQRRKNRQTRLTAEEIRAFPEHLDATVYSGVLSQFTDSMVPPFDLAAEEVRAYLVTKKIARLELMRLFGTGLPFERAAERFAIPPAERGLITQAAATGSAQTVQWGFSGPTVPLEDYLRRAPSPRRGGDHLSYDELLSLLDCTFANPQRANPATRAAVELETGVEADVCRATDRSLVRLTLDVLDRQHRFLRLARHVPWTLAETDLLVTAVGGGQLGEAAVTALADIAEAAEGTGLSAEELAFLFTPFDASHAAPGARFDGHPGLYARTFLSRTDGGGALPPFVDPAANPATLASVAPSLAGALGVSAVDLDRILQAAGLTAGNVTFSALTVLYRHARLARALGLDIESFELLRARVTDPFASTGNLLAFREASRLTMAAGVPAGDLAIVLGASPPPVPGTAPLLGALDELFDSTEAQLAAATGATPTRAAVLQAIVDQRSWTTAVTSWLDVDSRFGATLLALDRATGPGQLLAALYAGPPTAATLELLGRLPVLIRALDTSPDQAHQFSSLPGVVDLLQTPSWANLENALRFRALLAEAASADGLVGYLAQARDAAVPRAVLAAALAAALGLGVPTVEGFWDALFGAGSVDRARLLTGAHYAALRRCDGVAKTLGATPQALKSWARAWPTQADATGVRNAIRSRLAADEWLKTSTAVQDELRNRRRDALVRYLLATAGTGDPASVADLYGHFLIDVQMDACMDTSRIVQANAAIQLFVQRCFLGLENVSRQELATDHWKQWDFRQRYRLWEANRLVFLYPENFLNVARRSNASPLFREFAKEVRQSEKDDESVRQALDTYLGGLEAVANLDYAVLATNLGGDEGFIPELHVVARSRSTPQKHYHRKLSGSVWTAWEPLDVGTPGAHLALFRRRGVTTLVWPTFVDHPDPRQRVPAAAETAEQDAPPPRGVTYLGYGWVTRDRKKWSSVQTSTRALLHQRRGRTKFLTVPSSTTDGVALAVYAPLAPVRSADEDQSFDVPHLGVLELQRDVVSITVNDTRRALSNWLGGDHQPQLDATGVLAPISLALGADCNCYFEVDSSFTPWPGLAFVDNRMVARLDTSRLRLRLETATPGTFQTIPVLDARFFSVAPDLTSYREVSGQPVKSGFSHFTSFMITNSLFDFSRQAFAVTDQKRSFLCLSRSALATLAADLPSPSGAEIVLFPAYHPFATELREVVRRYDNGLDRLFRPQTQETPGTLGRAPLSFTGQYGNHGPLARFSAAEETLDFEPVSPYALYNWELFFHVPLFVAEQLRAATRFEDAQRYFHYIFTPFTSEPVDPARPKARYWVPKPFRNDPGQDDIRDILLNGAITGINPFADIENHPFDAQMVAQARPTAYQKHVVMRYLDNLIGWGDSRYRRGQREDVYEAIQFYLLAQSVLGPRPEKLQPLGKRTDRSFEEDDGTIIWGGGANALVDLENLIQDAGEEPEESDGVPLVDLPIVPGLYFCVPPNQTLLRYWTEVERRLYNIRHCLTIDGVPVRYDLLAAPIDPQALVDAAAAGVSVAEALAMAGAQLPPNRFRVMWGKAWEACNDVRSLGAALLSALEKRDAEQLAAIRSTWDGKILEKTRRTRELQRDQSLAEVEALLQGRTTVEARRDFYRSREYTNELEQAAVGLSIAASALDTVGFVFDVLGGVLYLIPNIDLGISGFGGTPAATAQTGGENIGSSVGRTSQGLSRLAGLLDRAGNLVSTQAGYVRRKEEWDHQASQATLELAHVDRQIAAARLRVEVGNAELRGHEAQEKSWEEIDAVLREKFSSQERYGFMIEGLADLYRQAFEHAVRLAKLCRECLAFELPNATVPPIGAGHWDSLQHGLLAGERLAAELRDLDVLHATERSHERTVTQHVPLSHVAPAQLLDLRRTGACSFTIPRWWFQRYDPMLRNRRVRSLSVSVPSVTGPYVGMNATLRFHGSHRTLTAISLSTGVNDAGGDMTSAPDQYLPFEGISLEAATTWSFGFPQNPAAPTTRLTDVDYSTISDVIMHVEYTADPGTAASLDGPPELIAFVDLRQMAPDAWAQLVSSQAHTCTVIVEDLVPRFLAGYRPTAVLPITVAVQADGTIVTGKLGFTLGTGAATGTLSIAARPGEVVDWPNLAKVFVAMRMGT